MLSAVEASEAKQRRHPPSPPKVPPGAVLSPLSTSSSSPSSLVHSFHVFDGDVVHMFGDCQARFQHCVMKAEPGPPHRPPHRPSTTGDGSDSDGSMRKGDEEEVGGSRISLVFKQSSAFL